MNLSPIKETFGQDNQTWLGSAHGTSSADTATLDLTTFTQAVHYPNGYLPSGTPLAKITSSGKYGPYEATGSVTASTTAGSTTLTATTGTFNSVEVGDVVSGAGIPGGTVVDSVTDATHVVMSQAATATATGVAVALGDSSGRETLAGFLLTPVRVVVYGSGAVEASASGPILLHGEVVQANLPFPIDAAGIANVAGRIIFV
jgi:hypothetical protein